MIITLGIPGQLAAMRETINGAWPAWRVTGQPHAFANIGTLSGTVGTDGSATTTSATYIDALSVTGAGLLHLAYAPVVYQTTATTGWLRVEIDGTQLVEVSSPSITTGTGYIYAVGIANPTTPLTGVVGFLLDNIPFITSLKLQIKRSAGGGNVAARWRYTPMEVRA
jgi:hypothetical protein